MSDKTIVSDRKSKSNDVRTVQAKRFWDLGIGSKLGFSGFAEYLATIPKIPAVFLESDYDYPFLVLVETRMALEVLCVHVNINCKTFVEYDERHSELTQPTWIRVQNGRKNCNRSVSECRKSFTANELGLTALQGVCTYLQHPSVLVGADQKSNGHTMELPGSIPHPKYRHSDDGVAYLAVGMGWTLLYWHSADIARSMSGSASRRKY